MASATDGGRGGTDLHHIISVTKSGALLAERLRCLLPNSILCVPAKFRCLAPQARAFNGSVAQPIAEAWATITSGPSEEGGLVLIAATGVAVRLIAPHLRHKRSDPAVVVVGDQGRFAISLLSGHRGGANALARRVAGLLGAQPVVTTASDGAGTIAVDLLGWEFGWQIEEGSDVTGASAAIVNGEPVAVWQEAGEQGWWPPDRPLPDNISVVDDLSALAVCETALVITDRLLDAVVLPSRTVVYRPRILVAGIGCNRGTSSAEIEEAIASALAEARLAWRSVRNLATIDAKRDEAGLSECAVRNGWPIQYYSAAELNAVVDIPNPSETVRRELGTLGVCEPSALRSAGASELLLPKRKSGNVTVAVARVAFEEAR